MDDCVFAEESLLHWYGGYCDRLDFGLIGTWVLILPHLWWGKSLSLVGYSSHLGVEWGFSKWLEVVVANNVVGPAEGQVVSEGIVCSWILSSICNQQFGGSGEYNVHTHHIERKGS
jgi:hypothetical protein